MVKLSLLVLSLCLASCASKEADTATGARMFWCIGVCGDAEAFARTHRISEEVLIEDTTKEEKVDEQ